MDMNVKGKRSYCYMEKNILFFFFFQTLRNISDRQSLPHLQNKHYRKQQPALARIVAFVQQVVGERTETPPRRITNSQPNYARTTVNKQKATVNKQQITTNKQKQIRTCKHNYEKANVT